MTTLNRRAFMMNALAAAPVIGALSSVTVADQEKSSTPPLCVFSKHLQFLNYKELAKVYKELGLTVWT